MAQEKPNRFVEWYLLAKAHWPVLHERFREWCAAVREEPILIWETPAVRYTAYGLAGMIGLVITLKVGGALVPPPPVGAKATATTADYHVVCSDANCGHHFVIHRKFGFRGFPVECTKCGKPTGQRAVRCNSKTCQGRWIAPLQTDAGRQCPLCGQLFE
jgi:hypothetical protein